MSVRCGECKYWDSDDVRDYVDGKYIDTGYRYCNRIVDGSERRPPLTELAYTSDAENYASSIRTLAIFGCVLGERA